jgi:hypothetical protein
LRLSGKALKLKPQYASIPNLRTRHFHRSMLTKVDDVSGVASIKVMSIINSVSSTSADNYSVSG